MDTVRRREKIGQRDEKAEGQIGDNMIKVAIMGYGTIGSGVYEVLKTNQQIIAANVGQEIQVKYILDLREFPGTEVEKKIIHDFSVIAEDEEIQC